MAEDIKTEEMNADDRLNAGSAETETISSAGSAEAETIRDAGSAEAEAIRSAGSAEAETIRDAGSAEAETIHEAGSAEAETIRDAGSAEAETIRNSGSPEFWDEEFRMGSGSRKISMDQGFDDINEDCGFEDEKIGYCVIDEDDLRPGEKPVGNWDDFDMEGVPFKINHDGSKYADFTPEMAGEYKILTPDIFPMHLDLIGEVFRMYGYDLEILKYRGKQVIDKGLQFVHNDMCYPAICSIGQQLYALTCGDYDPHKVALIQFQTGGGCRASNYIKLLRKALERMGMPFVPVLSVSFIGMEKFSGFKISLPLMYKGLISVAYGDLLMLLKNQVQPYEVRKGQTQRLVEHWNKKLIDQFKNNKGLTPHKIKDNMRKIVKDFQLVEKTDEEKTKVGIVGEIYVKYSPFGNNGLEEFLASQDCEVMVPGVMGFAQYCFVNTEIDHELYGGNPVVNQIIKFAMNRFSGLEKIMLNALKGSGFVSPIPFSELRKKADLVLHRGVKMGEGWLLPAEMAELIESGYSNIVTTQPFGCLPNHIVSKGVVRRLRELYPESNICPIDYDAGATKVNQENRIKLMLAVAAENRERARQEREAEQEA